MTLCSSRSATSGWSRCSPGGTTLLFVSHDINQVKQLCKRAIWIDHGHLRGDGPAEEVCNAYVAAMERGE
mgnify:CR=1 FL=1